MTMPFIQLCASVRFVAVRDPRLSLSWRILELVSSRTASTLGLRSEWWRALTAPELQHVGEANASMIPRVRSLVWNPAMDDM